MSQDCRATDIQRSYVQRNGLSFTRSESDWQFDCITNNGISSSVEEPEWDRSNAKGSELMFGDEDTINETMCGTRVH